MMAMKLIKINDDVIENISRIKVLRQMQTNDDDGGGSQCFRRLRTTNNWQLATAKDAVAHRRISNRNIEKLGKRICCPVH